MTFGDEDAFNEYLNDTKTDVATFGQELADKGVGRGRAGQCSVRPTTTA